jgi:hypothetical protein
MILVSVLFELEYRERLNWIKSKQNHIVQELGGISFQFVIVLLTVMWGAQHQSLLHCWETINEGLDYLLHHRLYVAYPNFVLPEHLFGPVVGFVLLALYDATLSAWAQSILWSVCFSILSISSYFRFKCQGSWRDYLTFNFSFCIVLVSLPYLIRTPGVSPQRVFWYAVSIHWHSFRFLLTFDIHWLISVIIQASKQ